MISSETMTRIDPFDKQDAEHGAETKGPSESVENGEPRNKLWPLNNANKTAVRFGLRLSIVVTLSSLFVLVQNPDDEYAYPQGTWVFVSALMVSWFSSMDVVSIAEKTFQRILGMIVGSCLGVGCGFLSVLIQVYSMQAMFIGICIATVTFLVSFAMVAFQNSFFSKYLYASLLCLLMFGITILPFYTDNEDEWRAGVYRITNVIIGCAIAAIGAFVFGPRSSEAVLKEKVDEQVKLAGEASEAVMQFASKTLASHDKDGPSTTIVTESKIRVEDHGDDVNDTAYQKYKKAFGDYKSVQEVFPLAKFNPSTCTEIQNPMRHTGRRVP